MYIAIAVLLVITVLVLADYPGPGNVVFAEVPTRHLLALVPMTPGPSPQPPYNRGGELISAAQLAVERINMRDDILPGYKLELVPANAETCDQSLVTEAPVNFVRDVTRGSLNIVGVVGLVCSTVTQAISPLTGRSEIDLLQISAGAIAPVFSSEEEYPRLYRMTPSSEVYNDAVLALMATFQWRRISMVRDNNLIQHSTTADNFVAKVSRAEFELVFMGEVSPTIPTFPIQNLLPKAAKIIYASVTVSEARELLCESYQKDLRWPKFVWLFHDLSFEDLMESTENCSNGTMLRALEGVFLLQYRLQPNPNTTLVSGQTYSDYLVELQDHTVGTQENHHANALHDSIWAFALALNMSLSESYGRGLNESNVTELVEQNLKSVHFSGTLGDIAFNEEREVVTEVDIFHVREGKVMHAGYYNPLTCNVTVYLPLEVPNDDFKVITDANRIALPIVTYICIVALFVFTTVILVLFIYYWNKPSIKASSPYLSLLILFGCYILYIGCLFAGVAETSKEHLGPLCQAQVSVHAMGVQLIYSALFMRLLRIYRIFSNVFKKPGKIWSDPAMVVMTFIPISVTILLLILWSVLDPIVTGYFPPVFVPVSDPPYYKVDVYCKGEYILVWFSIILFGVNGFTIMAVAIIATLTRKIHLDIFKDTKQVNAFVFSTVVCLCVWFPYTAVFFFVVSVFEAAYVFNVLPYFVIGLLCKVFLFVPKIQSARHERCKRKAKDIKRIAIKVFK